MEKLELLAALELDHDMLAAETVACKRTPGGPVGQLRQNAAESRATENMAGVPPGSIARSNR
jgi:hypothetical protein